MINSETIQYYRKVAKKIGLWDKSYTSLKKDLPSILDGIREKDRCLDVVGASIEQMKLVVRLLTYGDSDTDLSDEQLEIMLSPLNTLEDLNYSAYLMKPGVSDASDKLFPFIFGFLDSCEDANNYERDMRVTVAGPANLSAFSISYSIAMSICMRKYDNMSRHYKTLISFMEKSMSSSEDFLDKYRKAFISFKRKITDADGDDYYKFILTMGGLLAGCNLGYIPSRDMGDVIDYINSLATPSMKQFISDSNKFKLLQGSIDKYYELSDRD